jgi:hypothetical protein
VSYIVIVAYVLTSVVVAVLLENFTEASQSEHEIEQEYQESEGLRDHNKTCAYPLDPLLQQLLQVDTLHELNTRIEVYAMTYGCHLC